MNSEMKKARMVRVGTACALALGVSACLSTPDFTEGQEAFGTGLGTYSDAIKDFQKDNANLIRERAVLTFLSGTDSAEVSFTEHAMPSEDDDGNGNANAVLAATPGQYYAGFTLFACAGKDQVVPGYAVANTLESANKHLNKILTPSEKPIDILDFKEARDKIVEAGNAPIKVPGDEDPEQKPKPIQATGQIDADTGQLVTIANEKRYENCLAIVQGAPGDMNFGEEQAVGAAAIFGAVGLGIEILELGEAAYKELQALAEAGSRLAEASVRNDAASEFISNNTLPASILKPVSATDDSTDWSKTCKAVFETRTNKAKNNNGTKVEPIDITIDELLYCYSAAKDLEEMRTQRMHASLLKPYVHYVEMVGQKATPAKALKSAEATMAALAEFDTLFDGPSGAKVMQAARAAWEDLKKLNDGEFDFKRAVAKLKQYKEFLDEARETYGSVKEKAEDVEGKLKELADLLSAAS